MVPLDDDQPRAGDIAGYRKPDGTVGKGTFEHVPCPECGSEGHDPKTGFCPKERRFHCANCCVVRLVKE